MKIAVAGLWHLGCVTAACLAKAGYAVLAYDADADLIDNLQKNTPPISEPGLQTLLAEGVSQQKISFTSDMRGLVQSDIVWVCFDTPVDTEDGADVGYVISQINQLLPQVKANALIIISSQVPVGTTSQLSAAAQRNFPDKNLVFTYVPENLRLGKALDIFMRPDRIVIGLDNPEGKDTLTTLLQPFSEKLIWMSVVSAEMTKHAINAFLAISVTYVNELAAICESVGANARDVEAGLRSEERIGPKAYLRPGDAIAGGTLMRDVNYLLDAARVHHRDTLLLDSVQASNSAHKKWVCRKLADVLQNLQGRKIAMLGLTYKAGTDTLRRSVALETCEWLHAQGVEVHAFDPAIAVLPAAYSRFLHVQASAQTALEGADAVIIATAWPDFKNISADEFYQHLNQPHVLDPSGFMEASLSADSRIKYFSVGVSACN